MIRRIAAGDRKIMLHVNQWMAPKWIRAWMLGASRAGDGWLWIALGLMLLLLGGERRFEALAAGLLSVGAGLATFFVLKRVTGRERPCAIEAHCWSSLLPPDRYSFPSGHTITAFAVAVPFGLIYPSLLGGLLFCAASIAASRVVLGLHYLSDVLAGLAIGAGLGLAAYLLVMS
ncbi:MAG TPA: phosphatase PAP2 family protein [Bryobacteraceae bacterium]|jgi:undecaprenyl-diphosphatase|nr:phosphatase PAP2 family protein [Bryobacteraceae bacterium]